MTNPDIVPDKSEDFAAAVMRKIETEHIAAHSRLRFVAHDIAFWSLWFLSALIGAFALSATVFVLGSNSWKSYLVTHDSLLSYLTDVMPYIWLFLFGFMCVLTYVNLRHTPKGYRYSAVLLIILNLSVTILLSIILSAAGLGEFVDEQVGAHVPLYSTVSHRQELEWFKPDEGLLIGTVVSADRNAQGFVIEDPNQEDINIDGHLLSDEEWQLLGVPAVHVRVIGVPKDMAPFVACVVFPVLPPGMIPLKLNYEPERNLIDERNIECKGIQPYERFDQIKHW